MFNAIRISLSLLFLMLAAWASVGTQQDAPEKTSPGLQPNLDDQTYRVRVDLINVFCSVWDKDTKSFVSNLTQNRFKIYEDDTEQTIQNFSRETNLPLTISMLIDTSQSVAPKLKFEQEAATSFFFSVLKKNDRAMLVEFDSGVSLVQDFTSDANQLAKQIQTLRAAGGTALYDAVYLTCDQKLIRETGRKTIIIVSDGEDMSSEATYDEALQMALHAEATVFGISVSRGGFFGVERNREGDKTLERLAETTGGRVFYPFKVDDLDDAFRQINQELRTQYNIGYFSNNTTKDGNYRKIKIKLSEKGMRIRYRKGYYAPTT